MDETTVYSSVVKGVFSGMTQISIYEVVDSILAGKEWGKKQINEHHRSVTDWQNNCDMNNCY